MALSVVSRCLQSGRRLVSAGGKGSGGLTVWDIGSGSDVRKAASLEGHTVALTACAWSPDGTLIASASEDGTVCVWDALTFHQWDLFTIDGRRTTLKSLQFSPDAGYLAWISKPLPHTLNGSDTCSIWRSLVGERPKKLRLPSDLSRRDASINALSFDPEGRRIATAHGSSHEQHEGNVVRIWDVATGTALAALAGHTRYTDVSFSPDGRSVFSAAARVTKIWDAQSWEETASFKLGGWTDIQKTCFSPDGKHVAAASLYGDSKVQLWRIEDGSCVAAFPEHGRSVEHVAFSQRHWFKEMRRGWSISVTFRASHNTDPLVFFLLGSLRRGDYNVFKCNPAGLATSRWTIYASGLGNLLCRVWLGSASRGPYLQSHLRPRPRPRAPCPIIIANLLIWGPASNGWEQRAHPLANFTVVAR